MTKSHLRAFALKRMQEDPTLSYRALARVLDVSDSTVRKWRDEAGIRVRDVGRRGERRRDGRPAEGPHQHRPVALDRASERTGERSGELPEFDEESAPSPRPIPYIVQIAELVAQRRGGSASPKPARTGPPGGAGPRGAATDDRAPRVASQDRLAAITAELDARRPRGPDAVRMLMEAAVHLRGGVVVLRQYAEGRGCDTADIEAAERAIAARRSESRVQRSLKRSEHPNPE